MHALLSFQSLHKHIGPNLTLMYECAYSECELADRMR